MKNLNKVVLVLSKIFEIAHWVLTVVGVIFLAASLISPQDAVNTVISEGSKSYEVLSMGSFTMTFDLVNGGNFEPQAITVFSIVMIFSGSLMAMVFRNIYLICKTVCSSFADGESVFQKDITRMVREIGIFLISRNLISSIVVIITKIAIGTEAVEISMGFQSLFVGLVILYLSYVFSYGNKLQNEVDGLL